MAKLGSCSGSGSYKSSVNDAVCVSALVVDADTIIPIWENSTDFKMNGTVLIENRAEEDGWTVNLLINREILPTPVTVTVGPGESHAISVDRLSSIEVQGDTAGTAGTPVNVSFSLNYTY